MKITCSRFTVYAGLLAIGGIVALTAPVQAMDFTGKTVKLIVPFKEGGGGDGYGRLLQPYLQKYLPGNPKVLVVNKPGGGSIKGNNWFERKAKPDGMTAIVGSTSTFLSYIFGGKKVKYDVKNWRAVIASPLGTQFYARADTGIKGKDIVADIKALRKGKWIVAGKTPTSAELRQFLVYDLLGIKDITPLFGMSSGRRRKATIRGEVHLTYDSTGAFVKKAQKYVKKGVIVHYMTFGFITPDGKLARDPAFPNLPSIWDVYRKVYGKDLSGPADKFLRHMLNLGTMASKALLLPKGTSDDIYNTYLTAIKKTLNDKKFQKGAVREIGSYPQSVGKHAAQIIKDAVDIQPKTQKWFRGWMKKRFDVIL